MTATRKTTKFLAVILAMIFMISTVAVAASAFDPKEEEAPQYDMYLAFGDSISTGYFLYKRDQFEAADTLESFNGKTFGNRIEGSYIDLVADTVGIPNGSKNFYKFCREGMSALDQTRIVDPEFEKGIDAHQVNGSNLTYELYTEDGQATLEKLRKQYKKALSKAKGKKVLVTTMIGANDQITGPLMNAYFMLKDAIAGGYQHNSLVVNFDENFMNLMAQFNFQEAAELIQSVANVVLAQPAILGGIFSDEVNSYFTYFDRMDAFFNAIHDDFTEAGAAELEVVAVGLYNATKELKLDDVTQLRSGRLLWWYTKLMNKYLEGTAVTRTNVPLQKGYYKFAYARDVELPEWPALVTWPLYGTSFLKWFMFCSHPTYDGHKYICNQVLDTITKGKAEVTYDHQGGSLLPFFQ
ncbi:MAG: hypothetical protein IJ720_05745 [Clostridia bacterium]|nr:hypothetical protein [Clostridia bacterium]MBR1704849.1 hypothetical protein [Clostridia bacterium]